jgi:hypothetical protein
VVAVGMRRLFCSLKACGKILIFTDCSETDQNCIHEEIKSRLNSENACYHSVQSFVIPPAVQECNVILPVVLYGCETWSLMLREEHRLRASEKNIWT